MVGPGVVSRTLIELAMARRTQIAITQYVNKMADVCLPKVNGAPMIESETSELNKTKAIPIAKAHKRNGESSAIKRIPKLIEAFKWNQKSLIVSLAEEIAMTVESAHPSVSVKIRKLVEQELHPVRLSRPDQLLDFKEATIGLVDVVLPEQVELQLRSIVKEHERQSELEHYGLAPRHKVLLYGPPGNGKTMIAEALAWELKVPFLQVKYGGLVSSLLGDTRRNVQTITEYATIGPCVLFFDEFDGIGMHRDSGSDVAEIRRVTNQLLIAIERLPWSCVLVAATNAIDHIDKALKRRFDFLIEIAKPTREIMASCAERELDRRLTLEHDVLHLANRVVASGPASLSDVVGLCREIRRDLVLNSGLGIEAIFKNYSTARL